MPAEDLLRQLLAHFYVTTGGHLEWMYGEGASIQDVLGKEFELALTPYLGEAAIASVEDALASGD